MSCALAVVCGLALVCGVTVDDTGNPDCGLAVDEEVLLVEGSVTVQSPKPSWHPCAQYAGLEPQYPSPLQQLPNVDSLQVQPLLPAPQRPFGLTPPFCLATLTPAIDPAFGGTREAELSPIANAKVAIKADPMSILWCSSVSCYFGIRSDFCILSLSDIVTRSKIRRSLTGK